MTSSIDYSNKQVVLHILRNGYGYPENDRRNVRLFAATELERLWASESITNADIEQRVSVVLTAALERIAHKETNKLPMKYKRMEFNAQLQNEARIYREALEQLSLYVSLNGDDFVSRIATNALKVGADTTAT